MYMTIDQIAAAYGVSRPTVAAWLRRGAPAVLRSPAQIDPLALHRWLLANGIATDPIPPRGIMRAVTE